MRAQEALTRAAESSYRLADMRYRGGVDSYLGSLIAQRDMYDAQRALIVTRLAGAVNLVQLYQSLGGGWKESETRAASVSVVADVDHERELLLDPGIHIGDIYAPATRAREFNEHEHVVPPGARSANSLPCSTQHRFL